MTRAIRYRQSVLWIGTFVLAVAVAVLVGWIVFPSSLMQLLYRSGMTKPNTAFGIILLTLSLLLFDNPNRWLRGLSRVLATGGMLVGIIGAVELAIGTSTGFDVMLVRDLTDPYSMRIAPVTAANLILIGGALLLLDSRGRIQPSSVLTWITFTISFLTLTSQLYDPGQQYPMRVISGVGIITSVLFLLLCAAVLFARPERGVAAVVLSPELGGRMARRFLPVTIFVPFLFGLFIFKMYQSAVYGADLMVALFMAAPVMIFVPMVLLSAVVLNRIERKRKYSEQELRVSTQRFSSVVASAMDAIITLDESQRVIVFNAAAEKMFGCSVWDVLGKPLDRFLPVAVRGRHHELVRRFGEGGVTTRSINSPGKLMAVRANGEEFPIEATVSQVNVGGQKLYTVILRDITLRVQAEETLRASEERFRSIYEQAAVGIEQVSPDGKLLMVNAALCRMLGYEEAELCGKSTREVMHPEDYIPEDELLSFMQREKKQSYESERRYLHRDGSVMWANATSSLVRDSAGHPLYRISVIQDVTERKKVEEQLGQSQKMEAIGRLAGGIAHDFNTLLNVMLGYSELLLTELPSSDPRRERVMQIRNSGEAAALLTKQLLAFSRKQAVTPEVLDLREVISRMTPIVSRLLREDIVVSVKVSEEPCPVKIDPGQIQQLVLNLVGNAGDAMPEGGQLKIDVRAVRLDETYVQRHPLLTAGPYAMLSIRDSGVGMSSETQAHIFEPFFTTKDAGKGTGLGLATVYGIVKSYQGDIWVYSEPGAGTIFKIYLPFTSEAATVRRAPEVPAHAAGSGETVLLVEDSAALRELTRVILVRDGYHVLEAEDGVAALEVAANYSGEIHLVLTDVIMPRMRGPEMARRIGTARPGIKVVFLSGYTEEAISSMEGILGFTLVEKPYTADSLLLAIRRTLDAAPVTPGHK